MMRFWTSIGRGLRLRCPRCGEGRLFRGWFAMNDACSACALDFRQEHGYYVGAMYVNYLATAAVGMTVALLLIRHHPFRVLVGPLLAWAVVFPLVFFRWSRSLWLAMELWLRSNTQA